MLTDIHDRLPEGLLIGIVDSKDIPKVLKSGAGRPAPAVRGWKNLLLRQADRDLQFGRAIEIRLQSSTAAHMLRNELATICKSVRCSLDLKLRGTCVYILRRGNGLQRAGLRDEWEKPADEQSVETAKQFGRDAALQDQIENKTYRLETENSRLKQLVVDLMLDRRR
jgi:hypothetical protein